MRRKIRIVSGGLAANTRVYDADGNEIDHVEAVSWQVRGGEIARAVLEINRSEVHVWARAELAERHPGDILAAISAEMSRQREIHPVRPRHPYHWLAVLTEELLESHLEISRLAQEQAESGSVDARLEAAKRLRTELIQASAVCAAWASTLPGGES